MLVEGENGRKENFREGSMFIFGKNSQKQQFTLWNGNVLLIVQTHLKICDFKYLRFMTSILLFLKKTNFNNFILRENQTNDFLKLWFL